MTSTSLIANLINQYIDPYLQKPWGEVGAVQTITEAAGRIVVRIRLSYPVAALQQAILTPLREQLQEIVPLESLDIQLESRIEPRVTQPNVPRIPGVKNVIAVASGKGGVGKSTTAVNLALALYLEGARVGILDADIHGPNQPHMLGVTEKLVVENHTRIPPLWRHGIQSMSIGYLIDSTTPMIWRGPMVSSALQQLVRDTAWDNLDYLVIDLPPGTGDIQLTLAQKVPVCGAVIVTTPQPVALLDARKGLEMFRKVQVPVLGIVENMTTHICRHCGHEEDIFGAEGARNLAQACETEVLGKLPLSQSIRHYADQGQPIVIAEPESAIAQCYREIARQVAVRIALQPKDYTSKFPQIRVENNA